MTRKLWIYMIMVMLLLINACSKNNPVAPEIAVKDRAMYAASLQSGMILEAEAADIQSGTQTESCSEGGLDVGWIDDGDYLAFYNVDFGAGKNMFQMRTASDTTGGTVEIRLDSASGALVGSLAIGNTGGWQNWINTETSITPTTGTHTIYLIFHGTHSGLFNLNWIKFADATTVINAFDRIEAETANNQSGTRTEPCSEGGLDVGWIDDGDYLAFYNVDFGSGAKTFRARVAGINAGGVIELHLDSQGGILLGTLAVPITGGWQVWNTSETAINSTSGIHNIYLVFKGSSNGLFNINWITFTNQSVDLDMFGPTAVSGDMTDGVATISHARYNRGLTATFSASGWNGWCGVWIKVNNGAPMDLSAYNGVKFKAYSVDFQPWIEFEIMDNNGNHRMGYYYAHWTPDNKLAGEMPRTWTEYVIPFTAFGDIDKHSIKEFKILCRSGLLGFPAPWYNQPMPVHSTLYFDEMRFVSDAQ